MLQKKLIEQADACKETMYESILKVDRLLNNSPPTRTPVTDRATAHLKLPKLQLRSFNGDLTKWTASAVHNNTGLSDVEKFNSLLEHSARESLSGLALTATIKPLKLSRSDLDVNS